jgi:hypothetical protein
MKAAGHAVGSMAKRRAYRRSARIAGGRFLTVRAPEGTVSQYV